MKTATDAGAYSQEMDVEFIAATSRFIDSFSEIVSVQSVRVLVSSKLYI